MMERQRFEEKRKGTTHDPKHATSSVKHVLLWFGHVCPPVQLAPLALIDDFTANGSKRMNAEVNSVLCAYIQPNPSKLIGRHFINQQDDDTKCAVEATKEV